MHVCKTDACLLPAAVFCMHLCAKQPGIMDRACGMHLRHSLPHGVKWVVKKSLGHTILAKGHVPSTLAAVASLRRYLIVCTHIKAGLGQGLTENPRFTSIPLKLGFTFHATCNLLLTVACCCSCRHTPPCPLTYPFSSTWQCWKSSLLRLPSTGIILASRNALDDSAYRKIKDQVQTAIRTTTTEWMYRGYMYPTANELRTQPLALRIANADTATRALEVVLNRATAALSYVQQQQQVPQQHMTRYATDPVWSSVVVDTVSKSEQLFSHFQIDVGFAQKALTSCRENPPLCYEVGAVAAD